MKHFQLFIQDQTFDENISSHNHLCITHTLNFGIWNSRKKFLCIILINILEFVVAKFNSNLTFDQLHISLYWIKIRTYIIQIMFEAQNLHSI